MPYTATIRAEIVKAVIQQMIDALLAIAFVSSTIICRFLGWENFLFLIEPLVIGLDTLSPPGFILSASLLQIC